MAITASWYGKGLEHVLKGDVAPLTDTIKAALVTSSYSPNIDTHEFFSTHVTNELATGDGYTAGGVTLASKTITYVAADNAVKFSFANPSWGSSYTGTSRRLVVYVDGATPGTDDYLLGWVDFGQDESVTSGTFTVNIDADGALRLNAV